MNYSRYILALLTFFLVDAKAFARLPGRAPHAHLKTVTKLSFILSSVSSDAAILHSPYVSRNSTDFVPASVATSAEYGGVWTQRPLVPSLKDTMTSWFTSYMRLLQERPLITKSVSAAIVQAIEDVLSQRLFAYVEGRVLIFDFSRTLSFMLTGFFFNAPFLHRWYSTIARFGQRLQHKRNLSIGQRIGCELALDQSIGVFMYYPLYFYAYEFCAAVAYCRRK